MSRPVKWVLVICAIPVLLVVGLVGSSTVYVAQLNLNELKSDNQGLDQVLKDLREFKERDGMSIGCFNSRYPYMNMSRYSGIPLLEDVKLRLMEFANANRNVAKAAENIVSGYELLLNAKWGAIPWQVAVQPWYKPRFLKSRDDFRQRINWAKNELAERECSDWVQVYMKSPGFTEK
jgi:hypothetical protein